MLPLVGAVPTRENENDWTNYDARSFGLLLLARRPVGRRNLPPDWGALVTDKTRNALNSFRATAKKAKPTKAHRPALWENMLGTVYARNASGVVKYCDYRYEEAIAHIGVHSDVRVSRVPRGYYDLSGTEIPAGKLVWFVRFEESTAPVTSDR